MKKIYILSAFALAAAMMIGPAQAQTDIPVVIQKDQALAELVDPNAKLENIAGGFWFAIVARTSTYRIRVKIADIS